MGRDPFVRKDINRVKSAAVNSVGLSNSKRPDVLYVLKLSVSTNLVPFIKVFVISFCCICNILKIMSFVISFLETMRYCCWFYLKVITYYDVYFYYV